MSLPAWADARFFVFLAVLVVAATLILVLALTGNLEVAASTLGEWGQGLVGLAEPPPTHVSLMRQPPPTRRFSQPLAPVQRSSVHE